MRVDQVPQDDSILEGHRRACYARDEQGRYVVATSRGWSVERIANQQAVAEIDRLVAAALTDVHEGRSSPLAWHMARAHMDVRLLAAQAGFWSWQVRRHLRPAVFGRLDADTLARYARALATDVDALREVPVRAAAAMICDAPATSAGPAR